MKWCGKTVLSSLPPVTLKQEAPLILTLPALFSLSLMRMRRRMPRDWESTEKRSGQNLEISNQKPLLIFRRDFKFKNWNFPLDKVAGRQRSSGAEFSIIPYRTDFVKWFLLGRLNKFFPNILCNITTCIFGIICYNYNCQEERVLCKGTPVRSVKKIKKPLDNF